MVPRPIVHINGYPGVGKLTVARQLAKLSSPFDGKLVHNHLLINPADAILSRTQPGYQSLRQAIRAAVFSALVHEPATYDSLYIFTDFQTQDEVGTSACAEYARAAAARRCTFIPVVMTCAIHENLDRLVSTERAAHSKLTDVELVTKFREEEDVYLFEGHPDFLQLDVTNLEPEAAARCILEHVLKRCPEMTKKEEDIVERLS
ncbi:hypothetical protein BP6252_01795 [Coleophoma cylindrospora]|uniref:Uncharacterized protein n=1 Tax=Coleophoma cylindrospora TaxID=1849047 RepID=A0A3D8STX2_9HELO|nr:hypothetical protein BP6252_01795 [Coleophoma cylindrospora]